MFGDKQPPDPFRNPLIPLMSEVPFRASHAGGRLIRPDTFRTSDET